MVVEYFITVVKYWRPQVRCDRRAVRRGKYPGPLFMTHISYVSENELWRKPGFREEHRLLKNSPYTRFHPRLDTKYAVFGAFRARFVAAISSTPTFSTGSHLVGN